MVTWGDLRGGQDVGIEASTFFKSMHMEVITAFTYVDVEMTAVFLSMDVEVMAVYCPVNVVLTALHNSWTRSNVLLGGCGGDSSVQLADVEVTAVFNSRMWR